MANEPAKTSTTLPASLMSNDGIKMLELARELAMGIQEVDAVIAAHGLTDEQYAEVLKNPFFARVLSAEQTAWHGSLNTPERVKIKSAYIVERALPVLDTRIQSPEPLSAVTEAVKTVSRLAGMGEVTPMTSGEKFTITINLGKDEEPMKIVKDITPALPEPSKEHA